MEANAISTFTLVHNAYGVCKSPKEWICEFCKSSYPNEEKFDVEEKTICPKCFSEKTDECFYCGERYFKDNLDVTQERNRFCENCREECLVEYCDDCNKYFDADNATWIREYEKVVCYSCREKNYAQCECCNEYFDTTEDCGDNSTWLCRECYERNYCNCEECGCLVLNDESYYDESRGCHYCEECFYKIRRNIIHEYGYKPSSNFHKMKQETSPRYFGVELEVDDEGEDVDNAEKLLNIANCDFEENIYIKHDSSLEEGFEIVSHPMTLNYHMNEMDWESLMKEAVSMGYNSHNTSTCGLHIHVDRESLGKTTSDRDAAIANIIYLFEKFWDKFTIISRREERKLKKWANCYGLDTDYSPTEMLEKANTYDRYHAVNLNNYHTIEFRLFKGTLKYDTFVATLQLVDTICEIACKMTEAEIQNLTWGGIVEKIPENYSELINFLGNKNLIEKDKPIFEIEGTTLVKYNGDEKIVNIPDGITTIGNNAFKGSDVEEVVIPEGVTGIWSDAFRECFSLTEIIIPDGVIKIGNGAFAGCMSLKNITIPNTVIEIGEFAFRNCQSLKEIIIPHGVFCIKDFTFENCISLTSVIIPDSVTCIKKYAFECCQSLTNIFIPDSVKVIEGGVFNKCFSLENVNIPVGIDCISNSCFANCISLKEIVIPNNIDTILTNAFLNCISLTEVIISNGVSYIGDFAFANCSSLTSITIPDSVTFIWTSAFENCKSLTSITIPDSVTYIGECAFSYCTSLTSITIPDSVISIGTFAFRDCTSLTSITIPDSVTTIGDYAFEDCISLKNVSIPNGAFVGDNAFKNCALIPQFANAI